MASNDDGPRGAIVALAPRASRGRARSAGEAADLEVAFANDNEVASMPRPRGVEDGGTPR